MSFFDCTAAVPDGYLTAPPHTRGKTKYLWRLPMGILAGSRLTRFKLPDRQAGHAWAHMGGLQTTSA